MDTICNIKQLIDDIKEKELTIEEIKKLSSINSELYTILYNNKRRIEKNRVKTKEENEQEQQQTMGVLKSVMCI
jgi:hypothetical protein